MNLSRGISLTQIDLSSVVMYIIFIYGFFAFLLLKISNGKNWARITYLIFFIIGSFPFIFGVIEQFSLLPIALVINSIIFTIQLVGLFMIFSKESRKWFLK